MKIMFYKKEGEQRQETPTPSPGSDQDTLEFDVTVSHIENDAPGEYTIYTQEGYFYITIDSDDIEPLLKALIGGDDE